MALPVRGPFRPRFILANELPLYGLPDSSAEPAILSLVDAASSLIDEYCGRTDGNGIGSLVYTTYAERILFQSRNRNIVRVSFKPMVALDIATVNNLQASANAPLTNPGGDPLLSTNYFWTGVQANTVVTPNTSLSPILGASGRYGYGRRSEYAASDMNFGCGMNLLMASSFFGGPPTWTPMDVGMIDWDAQSQSGEIWVPAGLYMGQYTEMMIWYNSGYDPLNMPPAIKNSCAALVKNFLSRGGGTTGLKSLQAAGSVNVMFTEELLDPTIMRWLAPFTNIIAY